MIDEIFSILNTFTDEALNVSAEKAEELGFDVDRGIISLHESFINYGIVESYRDFAGVRLEDDVLVTENGCRVLGKPIPKAIEEVEALTLV